MNPLRKAPKYSTDPLSLIWKIFDALDRCHSYTMQTFLEGWFLGAPLDRVRKGNAEQFLAWAMFNSPRESLTVQHTAAIAQVLRELKKRYDIEFPPGFDESIKCIKFTLEDAGRHIVHRPLAFYVSIAVAKLVASCLLIQAGFMPYTSEGIHYWYRPSARPRGALEPLPLVFFHGISPGLFVYLPMLRNLVSGRAALLVDMPHIGMGLDMEPPSRERMVRAVTKALARHGVQKACVAGHSFGTVCCAWLVDLAPQVVAQLVLLDPVSILLALPDVASNFLYRSPRSLMEHIIHLGASSEIGINNTLRRHFWWYNSMLWAEDLERIPTVIHLASGDEIAPVSQIREYIAESFGRKVSRDGRNSPTGSELELIWSDGFSHGQLIYSMHRQKDVARAMFLQEARIFALGDKGLSPYN